MEKSAVDKVAKTLVDQAGNIGDTVRRASKFTSDVADGVQQGLNSAKSAVQDGRDVVEDFIDDTARRVKRSPIESILLSLTAGVAIGFLLGRATSGD